MWNNYDPREAVIAEDTPVILFTGGAHIGWAYVGSETIQIGEDEFLGPTDRWPPTYWWSFPPGQQTSL